MNRPEVPVPSAQLDEPHHLSFAERLNNFCAAAVGTGVTYLALRSEVSPSDASDLVRNAALSGVAWTVGGWTVKNAVSAARGYGVPAVIIRPSENNSENVSE